ncbi:MAG: hypothetical protein PVI06_03515 [Desulfobacterales bacterium]|jgi:hypothetical protein
MGKHQTDSKAAKKSKRDIDWDNRVLCSDGNCIGVIGPDGNCKECGKAYEGKLPWQIESVPSGPGSEVSNDTDVTDEEQETVDDTDIDTEEQTFDDIDWENRKLCSDGNCIGVIGADGRCKECGKHYAGD